MIRVLHSVGNFLPVSENWIYPQIVQVPGVEGRIICESLINREVFSMDDGSLILCPRLGGQTWIISRYYNALARRMGWDIRNTAMNIRSSWSPQILQVHFGNRGWEYLALKGQLSVPMITSFYGYDAWQLPHIETTWQRRYRKLFAQGDAFLVEGPAMSRRLQDLGCPADKICIQRLGVDSRLLPFHRRNFSEGLKVIMVGRFAEKKGMADGMRACALAAARGINLSLTVVGDTAANDVLGIKIKNELQELARTPELAGRVQFTGFLSLEQTRSRLTAHNVFLCPSRHAANGDAEGGSPVVLTEAMATGLLCIGTSHCDIPEVILNGDTGYLSKEGDFTDMADILCKLNAGIERNTAITIAARKHIEKNFSLQIQLNKLREIYKTMIADR
jgi:colanic acid/amylovoran biosynthesis glycosyltransferase